MLRNLFKASSNLLCKPKFLNKLQMHKTLPNFRFCSTNLHPTIHKISSGLDSSNIDQILTELNMTLLNQKYINQTMKHPEIFIDSNLLHICILRNYLDQLIYKQKEEQKNSGDQRSLSRVFLATLKIDKGQLSIKYELMLGKVYTNFYLYHSYRFIKGKEREQGLRGCCEMLRSIIALEKHLLEEECRRTEQLQSRELDSDQSQEEKFNKIDRIKHHALGLVDLFAENILSLSEAMGQLYRYHQDQNQLAKGIKEIASNIETALEFYYFLNSITSDSKYYFQLRINKAELSFKATVSSITIQQDYQHKYNQARKKLGQEFDQIYTDAQKCLDTASAQGKTAQIIKTIAAVMLSVKMERLQRAQGSIAESIEEGLIGEAQQIVGKIKDPQTRQAVSKVLLAFSKQMANYTERILEERNKRKSQTNDQ